MPMVLNTASMPTNCRAMYGIVAMSPQIATRSASVGDPKRTRTKSAGVTRPCRPGSADPDQATRISRPGSADPDQPATGLWAHHAVPHRCGRHLKPGMRAHLGQHALNVTARGGCRDAEMARQLAGVVAAHQRGKHLPLARGQE